MDGSAIPCPAKGRFRQGSLLQQMACERLPPGPASLEELFNFPSDLLKVCFDVPKFQARCRALLKHGIVEHSDYSGVHAEREVKRLLLQAMREDYGMEVAHCVTKTCDNDRDCQKVLLAASEMLDDSRSCVFPDILCQISEDAQAVVAALQPPVGATREVKQAAHEAVRDWLFQNGDAAVAQDCV